jgi:hypothetical protein
MSRASLKPSLNGGIAARRAALRRYSGGPSCARKTRPMRCAGWRSEIYQSRSAYRRRIARRNAASRSDAEEAPSTASDGPQPLARGKSSRKGQFMIEALVCAGASYVDRADVMYGPAGSATTGVGSTSNASRSNGFGLAALVRFRGSPASRCTRHIGGGRSGEARPPRSLREFGLRPLPRTSDRPPETGRTRRTSLSTRCSARGGDRSEPVPA